MAKMPNADRAFIEDAKLRHYLLDPSHARGGPKGRFLTLNGFPNDPDLIRHALLEHGQTCDVASEIETEFGVKYAVDGPLLTPTGRRLTLRTVWQIDKGSSAPKFVTLKPL